MRKICLSGVVAAAILFFCFAAKGQTKVGKVTGIAKSVDGKALDGATIILLRAKDNILINLLCFHPE